MTGESVFAVVAGLGLIAVGIGVVRYRRPYFDASLRWHRKALGRERSGALTHGMTPRFVGFVGVVFVVFGVVLVAVSPWVSEF